MTVIGTVDSLWRYPVKSMRGEAMDEAYVGFSGFYGDRLFAFRDAAGPTGFPWLSGRELGAMLLHSPRFRHPERARTPPNLAAAAAIDPGITPLYGDADDLAVDVETPSGAVLAIDDPALIRGLQERAGDGHELALVRSDRATTDCRPVSLFSIQTARQLGEEVGMALDARRFRANIYMDLAPAAGFSENGHVSKTLRIGSKVVVSILERDPRCKMITIDPDTAEENREILAKVVREHDRTAGVYGAVMVEGVMRRDDEIEVLD
ncbi:MAG: MOSC domain-containing protein [Alphaproteobacteria bacterium]|nr:MOSC domain-containing protein [Alphaproteobacteria bacterium]